MTVAFAVALACIGFGVLAVAYSAAPERLRRRDTSAVTLGLVGPAVWATFLDVRPTGLLLWDVALATGWVVLVGVLAAAADRRVTAVVTTVVAVVAATGADAVLASAFAVGLALCSAGLGIRLPGPKALAGGLSAVALLQLDGPAPTGIRTGIAAAALVVLLVAGWRRIGRRPRRRFVLAAGSLAALLTVAGVGFALTAVQVRADLQDAVDLARVGLRQAEAGDLRDAAVALGRARDRFARADRRLGSWLAQPVRLVPGIAPNHRAMSAISRSGVTLAAQAAKVAEDGDADDVRLRDGTIDLARVDRLRVAVTDLAGDLGIAENALGDATSTWLVPPVRDALRDMGAEVAGAARSTRTTAQIARRLPGLLGADGRRRWFVGVLGTSEARATGGIIGSHGVLVTDGGALDLGPMSRTAELNTAGDRTLEGVDEYVARYGRYEPQHTWQNITLSPDGPTVARVIEQLFPQSGGEPVDGVVLVDPFGLAALVRLVGPIRVDAWPTAITAENLPAILLHEQYLAFPRPERVDFLGDVAATAFDALTTGELPAPSRLAAVLSPAVRGGHLVLHSTDEAEQSLFAALGADGRMPAVRGDALAVVSQNSSGNKIDWFLRRRVDYDVAVSSSGVAHADLRVTLTNLAPATGLPDYVLAGSGPDPTAPGVNRMLFSVYSPLDLDDASIDLEAEHELGRNVYSGTVTLGPGEQTTVLLSLSGRLDVRDGYRLDVHTQPLVVPDELTVTVNGDPYP